MYCYLCFALIQVMMFIHLFICKIPFMGLIDLLMKKKDIIQFFLDYYLRGFVDWILRSKNCLYVKASNPFDVILSIKSLYKMYCKSLGQ